MSEWGKIPSSAMSEWIKAYNAAGVKNEMSPTVQEMVTGLKHDFIVCSDLERSIHSAQMLGYQSPNLIDALFREAELTTVDIPIIRLKPHMWSIIFRVFWFSGISANAEPLKVFKPRVDSAVKKLLDLAKEHQSVLFIGHGIINRFLGKSLISNGWSEQVAFKKDKSLGYKYWEYAVYTKPQWV